MNQFTFSTPRTAAPHAETNPPAEALWNSLCVDAGIELVLIDEAHRVTFANEDARRTLDLGDLQFPTRLEDVFGPSVAEILEDAMATVTTRDAAVTVPLMFRGHASRATVRPYEGGMLVVIARSMRALEIHAEMKPLPGDLGRLDSLTPREAEVLGFIGEGYTSAEIAKRLNRSIKTIEWHRVSIGQKLQTTSRVRLALIAQQAGLSRVFQNACPLPPR